MKIFLIRHARSEANKNKAILLHTADHAVQIDPDRAEEAVIAGKFLNKYFHDNGLYLPQRRCRMWISPYTRTRQTADLIYSQMPQTDLILDRREHILLCEQQFGLFDGYSDEELAKTFPVEYAHYKKCEDQQGKFWARMPMGESKFDVSTRVHQSFGTFHRDNLKHGIENIIIVSHGVTIRAFIAMWCHKTPEWFDEQRNPSNCSIQLIEGSNYIGYIHGEPKPWS